MEWKIRALGQLMSSISEDCYCAGWIDGNEYRLWEMVANPASSREYGQHSVKEEQIKDLAAISEEIGGWICWREVGEGLSLRGNSDGPTFTPMAEWLVMYETYKSR